MKKKTPYLDFYYKCMETGIMPDRGLCKSFSEVCNTFQPTADEFGEPNPEDYYWAYDGDSSTLYTGKIINYANEFTTLRQTIVLFLAAMNNEL